MINLFMNYCYIFFSLMEKEFGTLKYYGIRFNQYVKMYNITKQICYWPGKDGKLVSSQ